MEINFDDGGVLEYDEERRAEYVHFFNDYYDDYMDYGDAYGMFIDDIKNGNNSRIYSHIEDEDGFEDEEEYINGYGETPY